MSKPLTIILCEDLQHETFIRRYLKCLGYTQWDLRVQRSPTGRGSGEQFVRRLFPLELRQYRQRSHRVRSGLVAAFDADRGSVDEHYRQLELVSDPPRRPDEAVTILVPRRNIETWIASLNGIAVDEDSTYPKLKHEAQCQPAIDVLFAQRTAGKPQDRWPPSLQRGYVELLRLK